MSTLKIVLSDYISKRDKKHTLLLYVNDGWRKAVFRSLGIKLMPAEWDPVNMKIKGRSRQADRDNQKIRARYAHAADILKDYALMRRELTRATFIKEYESEGFRQDFLVFYEKTMRTEFERRVISPSTLQMEERTLRRLQEYCPDGLNFSLINRAWLEAFDAWHAKKQREKGNDGSRERQRSLKYIRKYLNAARDQQDERNPVPDPFKGFKWPRYKSTQVFLTEKEVGLIELLFKDPDYRLKMMLAEARRREMKDYHIEQYVSEEHRFKIKNVCRWFLFQCYTGVRYSDLEALTWQEVRDTHLVFMPRKTQDTSGKIVRMWIPPMVWKLIGEGGSGRLFPLLPSNQKYNDSLKEIARVAGVDKVLTTHVGRHTFATMSLARGIKLEVLQQLMGVNKIDTLMIYVHITQAMQDKAMQKAYS